MTTLDLESFRQHSKLFQLLDEPGQERLLKVAVERAHADGDVLMKEGEGGETFFVVLEGHVRISIADLEGDKEVAKLGPGAFVGEIAALMHEPRSATVTCAGEVTILEFNAAPVEELLRDYPRVKQALVKLALKRSEDNLAELLKT